MLDLNTDNRNTQIFSYLRDKGHIPSYEDIGNDMGFQKGYFYKFGIKDEKPYLKTLHTLAFEARYDIPRDLFFNEDIKKYIDIEKHIESYKRKKGIMVEYVSPESLEEFQNYKYFYVLNKDNSIVKREIIIKKQIVTIKYLSSEKNNFKGYANVSHTSIILIMQNAITKNSVVFKILLRQLISNIVPVSYLGHRTNTNEEVAGYGICSKKPLEDNEIVRYLDIVTQDFSKIEAQIIERIND